MYAAVSLEILVRFTYFTVKRRTRGGGRGEAGREDEVREDRCPRKGRDAGVDGGGGSGGGGGITEGVRRGACNRGTGMEIQRSCLNAGGFRDAKY